MVSSGPPAGRGAGAVGAVGAWSWARAQTGDAPSRSGWRGRARQLASGAGRGLEGAAPCPPQRAARRRTAARAGLSPRPSALRFVAPPLAPTCMSTVAAAHRADTPPAEMRTMSTQLE